MKLRFVAFTILMFLMAFNCPAQDKKSFNEKTPDLDSLIKSRAQTITAFYILLNQQEEVSTNEMSELLDLENEWAFVDSVFSPSQKESYYDADWGSNSSPIMRRLRELKDKLQLGEPTSTGKPPRFSMWPDLDEPDILITSFVAKGKVLDITFQFYSHPFEMIKAIHLPNGNDALELIKSSSK